MVGVLIRMKWAVLRRSLKGSRLFILLWQGAFAAAAIIATWSIGTMSADTAGGFVALLLAIWTLGWALGPTLFGGEDPTLKPEYFRSLPLKSSRLANALALASTAGITVPTSLLAFMVLAMYGARFGIVPAAIGGIFALLQVLLVIFLTRVITNTLRAVTKSQISSIVSSALTGMIMAFFITGWWALGAIETILASGLPATLQQALYYLPSGWGVVAIEAAARNEWLTIVGLVVATVALIGLLSWIWGKLLVHRLTASQTRNSLKTRKSLLLGEKAISPLSATVRKEFVTWMRDYTRSGFIYFAFFYSVFVTIYPVSIGVLALLPFAGILFITSVTGATSNVYGADGTALWQILTTPRALRNDIRGRQVAWLLVVTLITIPLSVLFTWWSGYHEAWPAVAAITLVGLGAGAGVFILMSVLRLLPMTDPQLRGDDIFEHGIDWAQFMLSLLFVTLLVSPVGLLLWFAITGGLVWLQWLAIPIGVLLGLVWFWLFGFIAQKRLEHNGPEILERMRRSKASVTLGETEAKTASTKEVAMSIGKKALVYNLFWISPVLIFPQGIVPAIFKLTGMTEKVWFLPLYLPEVWQWPTIVATIVIGVSTGLLAFRMYGKATHSHEQEAP